jgi:hypothetical protein
MPLQQAIEVLLVLGFDYKTERTRRDGLFGPIKAYHAATEEQVELLTFNNSC